MKQFKVWEISLAVGLFAALLVSFYVQSTQEGLQEKLIRLHVVANSDTDADQALKLRVRDTVLATAEPMLQTADGATSAAAILTKNLPALVAAAQAQIQAEGYPYTVTASVEQEDFPTRHYEGFALPAGRYEALRLTIGEGAGQNWWCVVFPPLCQGAASGSLETVAKTAGLTEREVRMIADGPDTIKFKSVELWQELKLMLEEKH